MCTTRCQSTLLPLLPHPAWMFQVMSDTVLFSSGSTGVYQERPSCVFSSVAGHKQNRFGSVLISMSLVFAELVTCCAEYAHVTPQT